MKRVVNNQRSITGSSERCLKLTQNISTRAAKCKRPVDEDGA
jgi:hypothetical protein